VIITDSISAFCSSAFCKSKSQAYVEGLIAALSAACIWTAAAHGAAYSITDLGTLGGTTSQARAINDSGQVVGYASLPGDSASDAFLWSNGKMTDLGSLDGEGSAALAINNSGQVVGFTAEPEGAIQAFLYSNGTMTDLGPPGGYYSEAEGINNSGQIVGVFASPVDLNDHAFLYSGGQMIQLTKGPGSASAINDSGQVVGNDGFDGETGFLYSGGTMTNLPTLTGPNGANEPHAINDSGQIAGSSYPSTGVGRHAALFFDGTITDLGVLGGGDGDGESDAYGINSSGQMVGFTLANGQVGPHAFLYSDGVMTDLNSLIPANSGWTLTFAFGINDSGEIVGYGTNPSGLTQAFLLTPVPEPASAGMFILGTCIILARQRRPNPTPIML
jgi:probable HAF family extracellular repeat protein